MTRHYSNWIQAYCEYTSYLESPTPYHVWTAIATIAGALKRRVWFDQGFFKWYPNFYIIFVAKAGVVAKSTSSSVGMDLLRQVPGIKIGPSAITWQALVTAMAESKELVNLGEGDALSLGAELTPMCCLTFAVSELGTLIDFHDRAMIDIMVDLWDGRDAPFEKRTKMSGNDIIEGPWINIIACVTPAWLSANMPEHAIGGGFASRCVFVHGEKKRQLAPYLKKILPNDHADVAAKLVADLEQISMLKGEYVLTPEAEDFGIELYTRYNTEIPPHLNSERFGGYISRKQTHLHKVAMIISAAQSDSRVITKDDLETADSMLTSVEYDMVKVFDRIGKTAVGNIFDSFVDYLVRNPEGLSQQQCIRFLTRTCDYQMAVNMMNAAIGAGYVRNIQRGSEIYYVHAKT